MAWLAPEAPEVAKLACLPKPRRILAPLFDFGKERLETLAPRVFIFGQPGLEQTPEAKSAAHTQRVLTMRALVRLVHDRCMRISEAVEIHVREAKS